MNHHPHRDRVNWTNSQMMTNFYVKGIISTFLIIIVLICFINQAEAQSSAPDTSSADSEKVRLEKVLFDYDNRKVKLFREKFCRNQDLVNRKKTYRTDKHNHILFHTEHYRM